MGPRALGPVLVTGGTGFIGSRLALRCLEEGAPVRVLGQENTPTEAENRRTLEEAGAEVLLGSVTDLSSLDRAVAGVDTVFHLAAVQHEMNVPDSHFREVNVEGTRRLLESSVAAGVDRFVHGSTIGVYGDMEGTIDEETRCRPDNIYGITKLEGERVALSYRDRLPVVAIRISEVYGPGDRRLLKLFRSVEKGVFFMVGRGDNLHHPIYVDDLVEGLLAAARDPEAAGRVFLLAGKDVVTSNQMAGAVARSVGRRRPRLRLPMLPFTVLATAMEWTLKPLGVQPPLHRRRLDFFRKSFRFDAARARDGLNFEPRVGFEEGAHRTAEWYRERELLAAASPNGGDAPSVVRPGASGPGDGGGATERGRRGSTDSRGAPDDGGAAAVPSSGHGHARPVVAPEMPDLLDEELTARMEPFDSFWEAPDDIERGYASFARFYRKNYLDHVPSDRDARVLVVSCGPGYMVQLLRDEGWHDVTGIDSFPEKIAHARRRGLNCRVERVFEFLRRNAEPYDVVFAEQELNHLTKDEILAFLAACRASLRDGGTLMVHSINGTSPLTGSEARAGNFDHYNSFTEYSLKQVLEYAGFEDVRILPLDLYVFWENPLNWIAWTFDRLNTLYLRLRFRLVGKTASVFTKKIGAACRVPIGGGWEAREDR